MSRLAELHAMNASLAAFNAGISSHFSRTRPMQELLTPHEFEINLGGHLMEVTYQSRWDRLDCEEEIVWNSIRVLHCGDDMTDLLRNETVNGLRHQVEDHFLRTGEGREEDYQ